MNRQQFEEAKQQSAEISMRLSEGNLTPEERQRLEQIQAGLAGSMLHNWLPFGWTRRSAMFALLFVGLVGVTSGNAYYLLAWLLVPIFSPRAMGEAAFLLGRISRIFGGNRH